jgi:hypothetical protein
MIIIYSPMTLIIKEYADQADHIFVGPNHAYFAKNGETYDIDWQYKFQKDLQDITLGECQSLLDELKDK